MVGYAEVKELVNNDNLLKRDIFSEEIPAKRDAAAGGARGPFLGHVLDLDPHGSHADL